MTGAIPWQQWWQQGYDALQAILQAAARQPAAVAALAVAVALWALLAAWGAGRRARALERRLRSLGGGRNAGQGLEERLGDVLARIERLEAATDQAGTRLAALAEEIAACVKHVAVVRFNAFDNTGGEQSFVLALLDGRGNGAVITTLAGREESRTYAKPIEGGGSPYLLSEEEREAIRRALAGGSPAVGEVKPPRGLLGRKLPAGGDR